MILIPRRAEIIRGSRLFGPMVEQIERDCRIVWVGAGDPVEWQHLNEIARRDARVSLASAGFAEMPSFYREAEICVIPTLASEGTSLSCLEGMASGCAMVTTHVGGLGDLIQDGFNGRLCDPTAQSLAAAVNELLGNRALRVTLAQGARITAEHYSLDRWRSRWTVQLQRLGWIT